MENKIKFRQGQRAWSSHFGWGKVYQIIPGSDYPVKYIADCHGTHVSYIADGREFQSDKFPTLFHKEQKLDLSEPEIEKGTLGYFWDDSMKDRALLGFYSHKSERGHHYLMNGPEYNNFCPYPQLPPHLQK